MARETCVVRVALVGTVAAIFALIGLSTIGFADPMPSAPEHGYGAKQPSHHEDLKKQKHYKRERYDHQNREPNWVRRQHKHRHYIQQHREPTYSTTVATLPPTFGIDLGSCNRQLLGSVIGAAAGAAVGSQIGSGSGNKVAIVGGTVLGFLVGGSVGRSMDQVDQNCVGQALERAETGQTVAWINPETSTRYQVTPIRTYQDSRNRYCREYTTRGTIDGRVEQLYGTACRQPDGSWQIMNS